jgi:hypothetical protein
MTETREIWSGRARTQVRLGSRIKSAAKALWRSPRSPSAWLRAFQLGASNATTLTSLNAGIVARAVHPDRWVACAEVNRRHRDKTLTDRQAGASADGREHMRAGELTVEAAEI